MSGEVIADKNKNEEMSDESDDTDSDEVYEVERVLEMRRKGKKKEYLVRWKNYGPEHDSWEPEANLEGAKDALNKFLQRTKSSTSNTGGKAKATKRGSTSTRSMTPKNKSGGKGSRGSTNTLKRVDKEELDSDDDNEEEDGEGGGGGYSHESDGEFEPTSAKKKKTTAGDPQQSGHKLGNRIQKKRKGTTEGGGRQRRSTSRPVEQDSLVSGDKGDNQIKIGSKSKQDKNQIDSPNPIGQTKALNSRLAINNKNKGNVISWISDSDDDSDTGEGGTKKGGEKEFKKNEAVIPDLIVANGDTTKDAEAMDEDNENGQKTPTEKETPSKAAEELAESPPIDPGMTKDEDKNQASNEKGGVRGESEPSTVQQESAKKLAAKATSSFPNQHSTHRSRSNSSSATIAENRTDELLVINKKSLTLTCTAIEDVGKHPKEGEEEEGTTGKGRSLRKKLGTNSRKNIASEQKHKSKIPSKLVFNALFRSGPANRLVLIANFGMPGSCEIQLTSSTEQKMVEAVREQLKKGPWGMKTNGVDDEEDDDEKGN